jgi:RecA/RadA recombinase
VSRAHTVPKHRTGIPGFDNISDGGLPLARATLVAGTAGSAKTVFATHFLASGILHENEGGVFVTFEDRIIDRTGMHIGEPFEHAVGILSGSPTWRLDAEDGEE